VEVGSGGRGSHSRDNSELVGSSLVAGRRRGAGWGEVEEGMRMLTSRGIGPRWPEQGDRRGGLFFGQEQRKAELERGRG